MLNINPVPAFQDNYFWVFNSPNKSEAWVVDPGDAAPVMQFLLDHNLTLGGIVITHHHADHTGGITDLLAENRVKVTGPASSGIKGISNTVSEHSQVSFAGTAFEVFEIPGHTMDHIAYFGSAEATGDTPVLFCGDTLFAGGCGRVFEGTFEMMYHSLQKLAVLPPETLVFCAHEYTLSNLKFALAVLPECETTNERMKREMHRREQNIPTVPTTLAEETATNIFLRSHEDVVKKAAEAHCGRALNEPVEVFAELRRWKDQF